MTDQLITLGQIDASDTLGTTLHHAALNGNKKALKKVLEKGIDVDYPNDEGQSPLFCACLAGKDNVVQYLLSAGADPNEKSNIGLTPVHAACYAANLKCLMKLLSEGGDLRLHDFQGRGVKDWAMLHPTPKKRMKVLEFLDKTRLFAMSHSGQDLLLKKASSITMHRARHRHNSVANIIRERIGKTSVHDNLENMALSHHSLGFGQVYANGRDKSGFLSAIPLVSENNLRHNAEGETYNNGTFFVMESMWWEYTGVTVKRLHRDVDPYRGGVVDLLINEIENIGKLRHPHILTLMGVCQTSNLDGLILIYERIGEGSLYNYLHQRMERLPNQTIKEVAVQMCDAIIFVHLRGLVHCAITSHAISVVNAQTFKLGNFEYMAEISKCELGKKNAITNNTEENCVYNWMAPEIMFNLPPSFYCDMYGYCAVLWEMFHGEVPFENQCAETIKSQHQKGTMLQVYHGKIAEYYKIILEYGLQHDPNNRKLSFLHVQDLLFAAPKDASQYVRSHFQHLQQNDNATSSLRAIPVQQLSTKSAYSSSPSPSPSPSPKLQTTSNLVDRVIGTGPLKYIDKEGASVGFKSTVGDSATEKNIKVGQYLKNSLKERADLYMGRLRRYKDEVDGEENGFEPTRQVRNSNNNCSVSTLAQSRWTGAEASWAGNHPNGTPKKPARRQYRTGSLRWESEGKLNGDDYCYTVTVGQDKSPQMQPIIQICRTEETTTACENQGNSTSDLTKYAKGASLERKTSSMGQFSYLNLPSHQRTRSAGAKPACHGQSDLVPDEYSTSGKLTTAGSLYALYNDHSPDLPMGQREHRQRHPSYTLPRTKQATAPPIPADPAWFGGQGSVRDLAKLFQGQIIDHGYQQAVLDGKLNNNCSSEKPYPCSKQEPVKASQNEPSADTENLHGSAGSLTTVSVSDAGSGSFDPYRIAFDVDDDSSSEFTSGSNTGLNSEEAATSSTDSDLISQWVDHELRKIGRKLSKEFISKQSQQNVWTPDLFETSPHDRSYSTTAKEQSLTTPQNGIVTAAHEAGDQDMYDPMEQTFFDDELYRKEPQSPSRVPIDNRVDPADLCAVQNDPYSQVKYSLPMKSILTKTTSENTVRQLNEILEKRKNSSKTRLSKIPTSRPAKPAQIKKQEGAYANIVTVKSSLDDSGVHSVTHEMKNLQTGGKHMVLSDTVKAKRVTTTFKATKYK